MIRPDQPLANGTTIENFKIERMIGRGGFGVTYLATEFARSADQSRGSEFQRQVAIKEYFPSGLACRAENSRVIPAQIADTEVAYFNGLKGFLREANTIAQLDHQNVVRIHSAFESHGTAYFVMPFLRGVTLKAVIKRRGQLSQEEIEQLILPVLDGLDEVHGLGIVHRDIKPENIVVLDSNQRPVLIDFGAAREKAADNAREYTRMSEFVAYTPGYAPFEQYSRATSGNRHEVQVDIYAICATLYTCITGNAPPESSARSQEILSRRSDPMIPATQVETVEGPYSPALLAAIDWGLQLVPEDRPASVAQLRDAMMGHVHIPDLSKGETIADVLPAEHVQTIIRTRDAEAEPPPAKLPEESAYDDDATRIRTDADTETETDAVTESGPPTSATEIYVIPDKLSERIKTERVVEAELTALNLSTSAPTAEQTPEPEPSRARPALAEPEPEPTRARPAPAEPSEPTRARPEATAQASQPPPQPAPAQTAASAPPAVKKPSGSKNIFVAILAVLIVVGAAVGGLIVWPEIQAKTNQQAAADLSNARSFVGWVDATLDHENAPENLLDSAERMLELGREHLSNRQPAKAREQSAAARDKAFYVAEDFLRGVKEDYAMLSRSQSDAGDASASQFSIEKSRWAEQKLAELESRRRSR